ncbi:MAG: hypothetical protein V5A72_00910 [Candidatus Nanohaloarchaea archaeon]
MTLRKILIILVLVVVLSIPIFYFTFFDLVGFGDFRQTFDVSCENQTIESIDSSTAEGRAPSKIRERQNLSAKCKVEIKVKRNDLGLQTCSRNVSIYNSRELVVCGSQKTPLNTKITAKANFYENGSKTGQDTKVFKSK